jgi:hypothetical protein
MTPRHSEGGPAITRTRPTNTHVVATTNVTAAIVSDRTDIAPLNGRGSRSPWAFASVYEPGTGRRRLWMYVYVCPHCHTGHLGRADAESKVRGPHRGSCGRSVWVQPARVYRAPVERAEMSA